MKYLATGVTIWGDVMQIKDIIAKDIMVKCTSREECKDFLSIVESEGIFWSSGTRPTELDYWTLSSREVIYYHIKSRDGEPVLKYIDYISSEYEKWEVIPVHTFISSKERETNLSTFLEEVYFDR